MRPTTDTDPHPPRALGYAAWVKWLLFVACAGSALYGALLLLGYLGQRALIYPAPRLTVQPAATGGHLLSIECSHGVVHALHLPAPPGAPTLVHFHGNGEQLADQNDLITALAEQQVGVLAVEYPGYGLDSAASPSEAALYAAGECALMHLRSALGVSPRETVLQGQSLGSGVAVEMARRGHGTALVLISPFTSMVDMAARVAPLLPARLLTRDRFDSLSKARDLTLPSLVIHGTHDEIIPFEMGRRLAQRLADARLLPIDAGGHNDLFARDPGLISTIARFAHEASHTN